MPTNATLSRVDASWIVASYLLGCFTAGYYWTRWRTGQDIRTLGSGNVGARNVSRTVGLTGFAVTLFIDLGKGALVALGARTLGLGEIASVAALVAVAIGHTWPVQLRFQGGKGLAVSFGALLGYDPFLVLCQIAIFVPMIALLRNFTLSGMLAFALGPLLAFLLGADKDGVAAMSLLAILVLLTHRKNIREALAQLTQFRPQKEAPVELHKGSSDEV